MIHKAATDGRAPGKAASGRRAGCRVRATHHEKPRVRAVRFTHPTVGSEESEDRRSGICSAGMSPAARWRLFGKGYER